MYKVFNMGHRLEVYLSLEHAREVIAISKFPVSMQIVGRIEESKQKELIINSGFGGIQILIQWQTTIPY